MNVLRALTGLAIVALILGGGGVDQAAAQCGNLVLDANIANFANCTIIAGELYFDGSSGQLTITEIDLANFGNLQEITMVRFFFFFFFFFGFVSRVCLRASVRLGEGFP